MKKLFAFILTAAVMLSVLCGCGEAKNPKATEKRWPISNGDQKTPEAGQSSSYRTYSELPDAKQIGASPLFVNIPDWRAEDWGYAFIAAESTGYAIVVASDSEAHPGESVDAFFPALYNEDIKGILMQFYRATYEDFTPDQTEKVTLACGAEALKFEGRNSANDYGTENSFPVYGYAFSYNDFPVIIFSIVVDENGTEESKCAEMNRYVDEIVQTIRSER